MKYFKKLHKDQLSDTIIQALGLQGKISDLKAVYSPLQPKNYTTDIWLSFRSNGKQMYVKMNISDKSNRIMKVEVLPDIVEKSALERKDEYKSIQLV